MQGQGQGQGQGGGAGQGPQMQGQRGPGDTFPFPNPQSPPQLPPPDMPPPGFINNPAVGIGPPQGEFGPPQSPLPDGPVTFSPPQGPGISTFGPSQGPDIAGLAPPQVSPQGIPFPGNPRDQSPMAFPGPFPGSYYPRQGPPPEELQPGVFNGPQGPLPGLVTPPGSVPGGFNAQATNGVIPGVPGTYIPQDPDEFGTQFFNRALQAR